MWLHPQLAKVPAALMIAAWAILRWRLKPSPRIHLVYVLIALMAATVLIGTALHLTAPYAVVYAARWLPFLVMTAVLVDLASSQVSIRLLFGSAMAGATVAAVGGLFSVLVLHEPRATGPGIDPNDLACSLVAALPFVLAFSPRLPLVRAGLVIAVVAIALAVVATMSRGGLVALAAVLAWVLLRRAVRARAILYAGALTLVAAVAAVFFARAELVQALVAKQHIGQRNVDVRFLRWEAALRMLSQHPIVGTGPGGFRTEYAGASHIAELDVPAQQVIAHSMYLETAAEFGAIGLVILLALIATAFLSAEHALRLGADRQVAIVVQASLIGVVVSGVFLSGQYFFSLWSVIALACAIGIRAQYGDSV